MKIPDDDTMNFLEANSAHQAALENGDQEAIDRAKIELDRATARLYAAYGSPFGSAERAAEFWGEFSCIRGAGGAARYLGPYIAEPTFGEQFYLRTARITGVDGMSSTSEELETVVLSLPRGERARLAARLLASLDEDPEIEKAWAAEVKRRLAAYQSGELKAQSVASVLREARSKIDDSR